MPQDLIRRVLMKIDKNYLPYEYFEELELFKEVEVLEGVKITKLPTSKGIYLVSILKPNTTIVEHYHNSNEFCYIKKGKIILNNKIELGEGDSFYFKPFKTHKMFIVEESEMYIQLIKDDSIKGTR